MDYNQLFSKYISGKKSVWHHKVNPTCQIQEEGKALMLFILFFFLSSATLIHYLPYEFHLLSSLEFLGRIGFNPTWKLLSSVHLYVNGTWKIQLSRTKREVAEAAIGW